MGAAWLSACVRLYVPSVTLRALLGECDGFVQRISVTLVSKIRAAQEKRLHFVRVARQEQRY